MPTAQKKFNEQSWKTFKEKLDANEQVDRPYFDPPDVSRMRCNPDFIGVGRLHVHAPHVYLDLPLPPCPYGCGWTAVDENKVTTNGPTPARRVFGGAVDATALVEDVARAEREKRAVAPLIFRVACDDGMLGDVPLRKGDGVVASLRLAPDLSFGAGRRACAGREVALAVAAAAVEARLSDGVAKIA